MPRQQSRAPKTKTRVPRPSKPPLLVITWWHDGDEYEIDLQVLAKRIEAQDVLDDHERDFLADFLSRGGRLPSAREKARVRGQAVAMHIAIRREAYGDQVKAAVADAMQIYRVSRSQAFEMLRRHRIEFADIRAAIAKAKIEMADWQQMAPQLQPSLSAEESDG